MNLLWCFFKVFFFQKFNDIYILPEVLPGGGPMASISFYLMSNMNVSDRRCLSN